MQIVSHILGDTFELGPRKRLPLGRRWDDQVVGGGGTRDLIKSHSSRGVRVRRFAWALFFFFFPYQTIVGQSGAVAPFFT